MLLQLCAVLSRNGKHKDSTQCAQKGLNKLIQCFKILQIICHQYKNNNSQHQTAQNSLQKQQSRSDRVDFKSIVVKEATKKIQDLSCLPSASKLVLQQNQHYQQIIKKIIFWKNNVENNEKDLRKQLEIRDSKSPRNLLGVQKKTSWVQNFHIGSLMSLKFKKIKIDYNMETLFLLSDNFISQIALYCSVCYFTIATETRFNQFNVDIELISISQRYAQLHNNETLKKCKLLHIKAIQIALKYLPPSSSFINHLLGSFNKNYKFLLDQIKQQAQSSLLDITLIHKQKNGKNKGQEYALNIQQKSNRVNQKIGVKKRSKTNDKLKSQSQSKFKFSK